LAVHSAAKCGFAEDRSARGRSWLGEPVKQIPNAIPLPLNGYLLDVQTIDGFQCKRHRKQDRRLGDSRTMANESDEPDSAAARLEAALDRIAAAAARGASASAASQAVVEPHSAAAAAVDPEIVARLDGLIERLRDALDVHPG
jgi:hypothetical protein